MHGNIHGSLEIKYTALIAKGSIFRCHQLACMHQTYKYGTLTEGAFQDTSSALGKYAGILISPNLFSGNEHSLYRVHLLFLIHSF